MVILDCGPVAQLARAPQWHCGGCRFNPDRVHQTEFEENFLI